MLTKSAAMLGRKNQIKAIVKGKIERCPSLPALCCGSQSVHSVIHAAGGVTGAGTEDLGGSWEEVGSLGKDTGVFLWLTFSPLITFQAA